MIGALVYLLCALTSGLCAVLLLRAYFRQRTRLLLGSGAAFLAFTVSNALLFVDFILVPQTDLSALRAAVTLAGIGVLLWALIWEAAA
jgi:hypothetical protein